MSWIWLVVGLIVILGVILFLLRRKKTFLISKSGEMEGVILGISKGLRASGE